MKRHLGFFFLLFIAIILILLMMKETGYHFEMDELIGDIIDFPLDRPKEAALFTRELVNQSLLSEVQSRFEEIQGWQIDVQDEGDFWQAAVVSKGILPSYGCIYRFDKDGRPLSDNYTYWECGWMK